MSEKKIIYSEPKEYISEELRRKYKLGEFAEEKETFKAHYYINDNCYIQEGDNCSHLSVIFLDVMDDSKRMNHKLSLVDENSKEYEIIIKKEAYDKLSKMNSEAFLKYAVEVINSDGKANFKLILKN